MHNSHNYREITAKLLSLVMLLGLCAACLSLSGYLVPTFWDSNVRVRLGITLTCYYIILTIVATVQRGFDFGSSRFHNLLYSIYVAILVAGIMTLALPYSIIGSQVSKKAILVHSIFMLFGTAIWLKLSLMIYFKLCPPQMALFITSRPKDDWLWHKINSNSKKYRLVEKIPPDSPELVEKIQEYSTIVIGKLDLAAREHITSLCAMYNKNLIIRPTYTDIMLVNSQTEEFGDLLAICVHSYGLSFSQRIVKRAFDLLFSVLGIILSLPFVTVAAIIKYFEDKHNPFYLQKRLTLNGREFNIIKLRTMIPNAEGMVGPVLAAKNDPRITKFGRFLRATRLDELPQLLNVLKGDMSMVGPRPERPYFYDEFRKKMPEFDYRLAIKSGITGYAQVMGKYASDPREKLTLDLMYIQHYSFMLDIKILFDTFLILFNRDASEGADASTDKRALKRCNDNFNSNN